MTGTVRKVDQHALMAYLIKRAEESGQRLGKKALQKKIHLIQELGGIDAGYRFSFYTYGPYSSRLSGDLDTVANSGGAKIFYDPSDNYYLIYPGDKTALVIDKGRKYIEKNTREIDRILDVFGGRLARELELTSTIAYLRRHVSEEEFLKDDRLLKRVKDLKPKYSDGQIRRAIAEVREFVGP